MASNKFGEFKVGLFVIIATLIVLITILGKRIFCKFGNAGIHRIFSEQKRRK